MLYHIGVATSATLYRNLTYDPRSFASVGLVTEVPMVMVGSPKFPPKTAAEFLAYVKEKKDGVSFAHAGIGAASHLCGMLFMHALDVRLTTVAYRGTGPAMNDLLGGQVDLICDQTTSTTSHILDGRVKGYAVTTKTRVSSLPNLPTLDEAGIKGFEVSAWHGIFAPQGTPNDVLEKLAAALRDALKDPKVIQRFGELGTEPVTPDLATPPALKARLEAEIDKWAPIIKEAGVYAD
jgi:tripartite-type tricarboxylate transporter receptor subunit TctC